MERENPNMNNFVSDLLKAAQEENWDKIDEKLVPQLKNFDGNQIAKELLGHARDENPNIRDVVATALSPLKISNEQIRYQAVETMIEMATKDKEKFPAGRAAVFLLGYKQDGNFKEKVEEALNSFKEKAENEGWKSELLENITSLREVF